MDPSPSVRKSRAVARFRRASTKRRPAESVSVQLAPRTRTKLATHAKTRGVAIEAAASALIDERLRELDDARVLEEAEDWQREQALVTLEKVRAGDRAEATEEELETDFAEALRHARARVT